MKSGLPPPPPQFRHCPAGFFLLNENVLVDPVRGANHEFVIDVGGTKLCLRADSDRERAAWMRAIEAAVYGRVSPVSPQPRPHTDGGRGKPAS